MYSRESRETGIPAHPCKDDTSVMNFGKNLQHNFPKMSGGGVKGRLELFRKFIRFGRVKLPLAVLYVRILYPGTDAIAFSFSSTLLSPIFSHLAQFDQLSTFLHFFISSTFVHSHFLATFLKDTEVLKCSDNLKV